MSKKERELRQRAAKHVADAEAILKKAEDEGRDPKDDETTEINQHLAEADRLRALADVQRNVDAHVEDLDKPIPPVAKPPDLATNPEDRPRVPAQARDRETEERGGWESLGQFATAVYRASSPGGSVDNRLYIGAAAGDGLSQKIGSEGGFLVPPSFSQTIWDGLNQGVQNLLGYCTVIPVSGESITIPANAETTRATSIYGGVVAYWKDELDQMTETKPKLREIKIEPHELYAFAYMSDKLLRNTGALEAYLTRACTEALNFQIGDAIINGTGAGQPLGVMNAGCLVSVTKETGQEAKTVLAENVLKMWGRLHPAARARAVWFINIDVEPQLPQMTIGVGTGGLAVYMPAGGISGAQYGTLMGRPVVPIEYCQTLGTKGDIILGDLGSYLVGRKGGINAASSIHLKFDYNQTAFRWIVELDGQPALNSALTPYKGTNTLSTFVTLNARA